MSNQAATEQRSTTAVRRQVRVRAAGVVGAVAAALTVWIVAVGLLGVDLEVTPGAGEPQNVGFGAVLAVSLAAALAGWGLLAALERFTARGRRIWTIVAVVVLVGSMGGPLAGVTTAATVTLASLHVAVGGVLITVLGRPVTSRGAAR